MPKKKHNIYTVIKEAWNAPPHKDTGNNNIYAVMGWKKKKTQKERDEEKRRRENEKIKKQTKKRVEAVKDKK